VVGLLTVALLPTVASKPLAVLVGELNDYQNEPLLAKRQCAEANICGWERTLCCENGQSCSTNAVGQAVCVAGAGADSTGGSWQFSTAVVTQTGVITQTSVYSTFIPAATGGVCSASGDCAAGYYCTGEGTCKPIAGPTPGVTRASAPDELGSDYCYSHWLPYGHTTLLDTHSDRRQRNPC
jgi:hypothetical protein